MRRGRKTALILALAAGTALGGLWLRGRIADRAMDRAWETVAEHGPVLVMNRDITLDTGEVESRDEGRWLTLYRADTRTAEALDGPYGGARRVATVLDSGGSHALHSPEGQGLVELDLETGARSEVLPQGAFSIRGLRYLPDSRDFSALFYENGPDAPEGSLLRVYRREAGVWEDLCRVADHVSYGWLDAGRVAVPDETGLAVYALETGRTTHWLTLDLYRDSWQTVGTNASFALTEGGKQMAYLTADQVLRLRDLETGEEVVVDDSALDAYPAQGHGLRFRFSPDGEALLYCVRKWKNALFNPEYDTLYVWAEGASQPLHTFAPTAGELRFDW